MQEVDTNNEEERQKLEDHYMDMLRRVHRLDTFRGYHFQWKDSEDIDEGDGMLHTKVTESWFGYEPKDRPILDGYKSFSLAAIRKELVDIGAGEKADLILHEVL